MKIKSNQLDTDNLVTLITRLPDKFSDQKVSIKFKSWRIDNFAYIWCSKPFRFKAITVYSQGKYSLPTVMTATTLEHMLESKTLKIYDFNISGQLTKEHTIDSLYFKNIVFQER